MNLRRIYRQNSAASAAVGIANGADFVVSIDAPDAKSRLSALYTLDAPQWVRLNLIASVSGSAIGTDGTSETLSNRVDRLLLGIIRRDCDIVLAGAASVRAEGYHLPKAVPLAIVTASGDLGDHRLDPAIADGRLLVLCRRSAVDAVQASLGGVRAEVVVIDGESTSAESTSAESTSAESGGRLAPAAIIAALRDRGFARILCEGGPQLATQLVADQLVDELCLSTSPTIGGPGLSLFGPLANQTGLELVQLLADDTGGLYARWRVQRPAVAMPASQAAIEEFQRSLS